MFEHPCPGSVKICGDTINFSFTGPFWYSRFLFLFYCAWNCSLGGFKVRCSLITIFTTFRVTSIESERYTGYNERKCPQLMSETSALTSCGCRILSECAKSAPTVSAMAADSNISTILYLYNMRFHHDGCISFMPCYLLMDSWIVEVEQSWD